MENKDFSDLSINGKDDFNCTSEQAIEDKAMMQCNINSKEIDKETISKLRGDAIGDTMYSQSSVIKLLLQLSDVQWSNKLEEDLCFLWDMTVDKDVCEYLFQLSFPSVATSVVMKYNEPRLLEIIIGILGNICSNAKIVPEITDVEVSIVLNALDTDDHLILIQIMRFLIAITFHRNNKLCFMTAEIVDKICFILTNSTNKELLLHAMDALAKITTDFKIEIEFLNVNIINSLLTAYNFINNETYDDEEFEEDAFHTRKTLKFFVQAILNICSYLNETTNNDLQKEMCSKNKDLLIEFRKIIENLCNEYDGFNLLPLSDDVIFYIDSFTIIFPVLGIGYDKDIFINVIIIIRTLRENKIHRLDEFVELMRYMISVSDVNTLLTDTENINCDIFRFILEHESRCDFNYKENGTVLVEKLREKRKQEMY